MACLAPTASVAAGAAAPSGGALAAKRGRAASPPASPNRALDTPAPPGAGPHWPWARPVVFATRGGYKCLFKVVLADSGDVSLHDLAEEVWCGDVSRVPAGAGPGNAYFDSEEAATVYVLQLHRERPALAAVARLVVQATGVPHSKAYLDALERLYAKRADEARERTRQRNVELLPRVAEKLRFVLSEADVAGALSSVVALAGGEGDVFNESYGFTHADIDYVLELSVDFTDGYVQARVHRGPDRLFHGSSGRPMDDKWRTRCRDARSMFEFCAHLDFMVASALAVQLEEFAPLASKACGVLTLLDGCKFADEQPCRVALVV